MIPTRCPQGHYYDAERYGNVCPHCQTAGADLKKGEATKPLEPPRKDDLTEVIDRQAERLTKLTDASLEEDAKTEGIFDLVKEEGSDDTPPVPPVVGWLVCVQGADKGRDFRLHAGRNFVGRAKEMDVCLAGDKAVSRASHAVVVYDPKGGDYLAQPGESKELFYLNDKLVLESAPLRAYDEISIGKSLLLFIPLCGEKFRWSEFSQNAGAQ